MAKSNIDYSALLLERLFTPASRINLVVDPHSLPIIISQASLLRRIFTDKVSFVACKFKHTAERLDVQNRRTPSCSWTTISVSVPHVHIVKSKIIILDTLFTKMNTSGTIPTKQLRSNWNRGSRLCLNIFCEGVVRGVDRRQLVAFLT